MYGCITDLSDSIGYDIIIAYWHAYVHRLLIYKRNQSAEAKADPDALLEQLDDAGGNNAEGGLGICCIGLEPIEWNCQGGCDFSGCY